MQELNDILPNTIASLGGVANSSKEASDATKANSAAVKGNTEQAKAMREAAKQQQQAYDNIKDAVYSASKAFDSLGSAIMSTKVSFEKYNSTLGAAGDAVLSLSKNFGVGGLAIGSFVKGLTTVTQLYTKQADAVLKASDDMSKMGTAGQFTSREILDMAHGAGLFTGNIEILTKSVKSVGTGMISLGSTVGEGTKTFARMVAVSDEQRNAFQRLGLSQEDLMDSQASYVKLQELSGRSYAVQTRDAKELQRASLEYTENLLKLSSLTGKDIKSIEKDKQIANEQFEEMVRTRAEDEKIRKLTAEGKLEEAASVKAEQSARKQFVEQAVTRFGQETGLQIGRLARTGAYDKFTSGLANLGVDASKLSSDLKKAKPGAEVDNLFDRNAKDITEKVGSVVENLDTAFQFGGPELGKQFGINQELLSKTAQLTGKDLQGARAEINRLTGSPKDGVTGLKVATDAAQVTRNNLTTAEIKAKVAIDNIVAAGNPLISGFNRTTIAATALAAAALAAAAALTKNAIMNATGQGKSAPGAATGGKGGKGGSVMAKGAGFGLAGLAGLGLGAYSSSLESSGNKTGAAVADVGAYALGGASFGSMFGLPGAAVGAALGAGYGLYQNRESLFGGKEKNASDKRMDDFLNFTGKSGDRAHFMMLPADMQERILQAAEAYKNASGNKLTINSAARTLAEQTELYEETKRIGTPGIGPSGMLVGKPGENNAHINGTAVDIEEGKSDPRAMGALESVGLFKRYGAKDPVHFEVSGNLEGIASGPESGYNALLHGNELIKRLTPNSVLDVMSKTPAQNTTTTTSSMQPDNSILMDLVQNLYQKMDDVVSELSDLNDTQSEIKKYSRA